MYLKNNNYLLTSQYTVFVVYNFRVTHMHIRTVTTHKSISFHCFTYAFVGIMHDLKLQSIMHIKIISFDKIDSLEFIGWVKIL